LTIELAEQELKEKIAEAKATKENPVEIIV
jgi:hypothetical protein